MLFVSPFIEEVDFSGLPLSVLKTVGGGFEKCMLRIALLSSSPVTVYLKNHRVYDLFSCTNFPFGLGVGDIIVGKDGSYTVERHHFE